MSAKTIGAVFSILAVYSVFIIQYDKILPIVRRLGNLSDLEQQVREGDLLPQELVHHFCSQPLRSLFLGTGEASGTFLENAREAYPNKLQDLCKAFPGSNGFMSITNLAIPYSVANDVARCAKHIIGSDDMAHFYDVIFIDYFRDDMGVAEYEGLESLAKRLRNRFPCATLIFLRPWYQNYIGYSDSSGWVSISTWAKNKGLEYENANQEFQASTENWGVVSVTENDQQYEAAVRESQGWALFKDVKDYTQWQTDDCKGAYGRREDLYNSFYHNNYLGHLDVARGITQAAIYANATRCVESQIRNWDEDDPSCSTVG